MDDEKLVEAVRAFDCLWKVGGKSYRDIRAKENAWKEVASKVNLFRYFFTIFASTVLAVAVVQYLLLTV